MLYKYYFIYEVKFLVQIRLFHFRIWIVRLICYFFADNFLFFVYSLHIYWKHTLYFHSKCEQQSLWKLSIRIIIKYYVPSLYRTCSQSRNKFDISRCVVTSKSDKRGASTLKPADKHILSSCMSTSVNCRLVFTQIKFYLDMVPSATNWLASFWRTLQAFVGKSRERSDIVYTCVLSGGTDKVSSSDRIPMQSNRPAAPAVPEGEVRSS